MKKPQVLNPLMNSGSAPKGPKISKEEGARKVREMYDKDHEMVTGVFVNKENPATNGGLGMVQFGWKKYKQDAYEFYELLDGQRYTLPRMVAMHLANGCYYHEYQRLPGEYGQNNIRQGFNPEGRMIYHEKQMSRKVHRYGFTPLDFMEDSSDFQPADIVHVTGI
jgi:hypothetical protein